MAKSRSKREYDRDDEDYEDVEPRRQAKPRRGGSRLFWFASRLFVVFLLLAALAFFAPLLIGSTGLWKTILIAVVPELAGKVDARRVKLSWLSPIAIDDLVVRDLGGQPLAEVSHIASRKSLFQIAINYTDLGVFDVTGPKANIILRDKGSNVEDLLAKLPKSNDKSGPPPQFGIIVSNGTISLDDQIAGRKWQLESIFVDLTWSAGSESKAGKLTAALKSVNDARVATGQIATEFSWQPGAGPDPSLGSGQAQLTLKDIPTAALEGPLRRFVGDIRPSGPLSLQSAYTWAEDGKVHRALLTSLSTSGLGITAPAYLGQDQPSLAIATGRADLQLTGNHLTISNLNVNSNLVQLSAAGAAPLPTLGPSPMATPVSSTAGSGNVELRGELDLAELARQLPGTLRLREGTQISSGKIQFSLAGRDEPSGRAWEADLRTVNLIATTAGRPVRFEQPLNLGLLIRQGQSGFEIEKLVGRASFLQLDGRGALAKGSIDARADLNQLAKELSQFVDLGNARLAGTLESKLQWSQGEQDRWSATADAHARNFEFTAAGLAPWKESDLHLAAQTQGLVQNDKLAQIDSGKLTLDAGGDRLDAELAEPVRSPAANSTWPVKFSLRGDLASWTARLQSVLPLKDWRVTGAIDTSGSGKFSARSSEVGPTVIQLANLEVRGPGVSLSEPIVKIETAAAWDHERSALTLSSTTFASSALAFRADGLRVVTAPEPSVVGLIDFRGDLARLSAWRTAKDAPADVQFAGALAGRVEIGYRGQSLAANWTTEIERFQCLTRAAQAAGGPQTTLASARPAEAWQSIWEEPQISFSGQGTFDPAASAMKLDRATLTSANASLAATGGLTKLRTAPEIDLSGQIAYSLDALTQQIQSLAQRHAAAGQTGLPFQLDSLQLTGKEQRQFALKGPLFAAASAPSRASPLPRASADPVTLQISEALQGEASLGWQSAQYVGLVAGKADVNARLAGGILQIGPLNIPVSEGRLTTAPRLVLTSQTPHLIVDRGPLIQNVRISPEMCGMWLKFVAPMVAEATRAEGTFSVSLEGAAVPLALPQSADVAGTLAIHTAQIGPGAAAQPILTMARQLRSIFDPNEGAATAVDPNRGWLVMPQQNVPFEVRQGAVYHRGLTFNVRDVAITTEGSVGIATQELNLVAQIPLQESWFKDRRFALLKGKTISIPIRGTLKQPQIDSKILEDLAKQLLGSALQGLLERPIERGQGILQRELGKGLDRLFGPAPGQQPPAPPER